MEVHSQLPGCGHSVTNQPNAPATTGSNPDSMMDHIPLDCKLKQTLSP